MWSNLHLSYVMFVLSIDMSSGDLFRNLMMDLVIAMTPYVDGKNIKLLYDLALPWLQVYICYALVSCGSFKR